MINGRPIKLSYGSGQRWYQDDDASSSGSGTKFNVIGDRPEIPNIKPPPPTYAMLMKTRANNMSGAAALVDAYGNAYENPMFAYDPVFQVGMQWVCEVGRGAGAAAEEDEADGQDCGGGDE